MQTLSKTKWGLYPKVLCLGLLASLTGCADGNGGTDAPATDGGSSAPPADGGSSVPLALQTDLQGILDTAVANKTTPGVVLEVSSGNGEPWLAAAGVDDIEKQAAMGPDESFRAGSIVKTFVATAVMQAVEAGTLKLTDVLTELLPAEVTARIPNAASIQVAMLLGHRSGIVDWVNDDVYQTVATHPEHVWTLDEILAEVTKLPAVFQPGERYGYSNTNYVLLGEILSGVTGRSWRDVIRDHVLARAGLEHTSLPDIGNMDCPTCAHGYVPMGEELVDTTRIDPSMAGACGGHALISTSSDLIRFLRRLRSGALFDRPSTLESMFAFQPGLEPETRTVGYGFGVMKMDVDGTIAIGHLGGAAGYMSFMLYVAATDRYVSGFINVMTDPGPVLAPILTRVGTP